MPPLRIAHVAPVATSVPPQKSGSVQSMTSLLTEGLVARGHDVTLFATADSVTKATLHSLYPHGYWHDPNMWPWELYEMMNVAAAVERADEFDIIHFEAHYYPLSLPFVRLSRTPIVQTVRVRAAAVRARRLFMGTLRGRAGRWWGRRPWSSGWPARRGDRPARRRRRGGRRGRCSGSRTPGRGSG